MDAGKPSAHPAPQLVAPGAGRRFTARVDALGSRATRYALHRLAPWFGPAADLEVRNVRLPAAVVAYFGDDVPRLYQLLQWIPALERLDEVHPVMILLRQPATLRALRGRTRLPLVCVRGFDDLMTLYDTEDYRVALYVNNGLTNFQSLAGTRMLHVHVNHGESDKSCMVSHQVHAYDRVFVAGDAAVARYREALLDLDERRLVPVGRPQLDLFAAPEPRTGSERTVLYAPTWEGENEGNNYTSVDVLGPDLVRALLAVPEVNVLYKPHPRIPGSRTPAVAAGHRRILRLIEEARAARRGASHRAVLEGDVIALMGRCDAMVTDVSSAGPDFLYLRTECPLFLTDRHGDRERLLRAAPIARCTDVIDTGSLDLVTDLVTRRLDADLLRARREEVRALYFGSLAPGESTRRFVDAVSRTIVERDRALTALGDQTRARADTAPATRPARSPADATAGTPADATADATAGPS